MVSISGSAADAILQFLGRDRGGVGGRGLQRLQTEPARLLQQRPHHRGSKAQHARGDSAALRVAARSRRARAAAWAAGSCRGAVDRSAL